MRRLPLVRRSRLETERARRRELVAGLEERIGELQYRLARANDGARAAQQRHEQAIEQCAQLVSDLRVAVINVARGYTPHDERLHVQFEVPSHLLWQSFRREDGFRDALAYMVEGAIMQTPELRTWMLAGREEDVR